MWLSSSNTAHCYALINTPKVIDTSSRGCHTMLACDFCFQLARATADLIIIIWTFTVLLNTVHIWMWFLLKKEGERRQSSSDSIECIGSRSIYLRIAKKADVDMVWSHFFSFRKMGGMAKYLWEPLFLKNRSWNSSSGFASVKKKNFLKFPSDDVI